MQTIEELERKQDHERLVFIETFIHRFMCVVVAVLVLVPFFISNLIESTAVAGWIAATCWLSAGAVGVAQEKSNRRRRY